MLGTIDRGHVARLVDAWSRARRCGAAGRCAGTRPRCTRLRSRIGRIGGLPAARRDRANRSRGRAQDEEFDSGRSPGWRRRSRPKMCSSTIRSRLGGRRDLAMAPEPRIGFEMTLLRMLAFRPESAARHAPHRIEPVAAAAAPANCEAIAAAQGRRAEDRACEAEHRCEELAGDGRSGGLERHGASIRLELRAGNIRARRSDVAARPGDGGSAHARHRGQAGAGLVEVSAAAIYASPSKRLKRTSPPPARQRALGGTGQDRPRGELRSRRTRPSRDCVSASAPMWMRLP